MNNDIFCSVSNHHDETSFFLLNASISIIDLHWGKIFLFPPELHFGSEQEYANLCAAHQSRFCEKLVHKRCLHRFTRHLNGAGALPLYLTISTKTFLKNQFEEFSSAKISLAHKHGTFKCSLCLSSRSQIKVVGTQVKERKRPYMDK